MLAYISKIDGKQNSCSKKLIEKENSLENDIQKTKQYPDL